MVRTLAALALVGALATASARAAEDDGSSAFAKTTSGAPKIKSINVIAFGPNGALLIGDGKGAQLVAVDTKDTKAKPWKAGALTGIDRKIADKLGTTAKNVEITHLAVNRASGTAYLVVNKKDESKSVIMTVDGDGTVGEFALDKVDYVAVPLPKGEKAEVNRVTDLAWAKGRILVGAVCAEEFASKVYSVPTPLDATKGEATGFSTETYHVAHRKWETKAPMTTLMPLEHKGKQYVVGTFACTPVVRYPIDNIKAGAKIKGESVIELGHGNQPRNMFSYSKDGKTYLLMNNFRFHHSRRPYGPSPYWTVRIDMDIFGEGDKLNEKAEWRIDTKTLKPITERAKIIDAYYGVAHLDRLDDKQALVVAQDEKAGLTLKALDLP